MKIAIQGEPGSFSHAAALQFEPRAEIIPCMLAANAITRLAAGEVDALALPIENSLAGAVGEHHDLLWEYPAHIERELFLPIRHALIALPESSLESIHRVYSHPVALAQCRRFLADHPAMEPVPFYDTAGAVKQLVEGRERHGAAIASELAATLYGGRILAERIEDHPANYTRFLLLRPGWDERCPPGPHKLSVAFQLEHRPGTLVAALSVYSEAQSNITRLQPRPIPGEPGFYTFFVDCLASDPAISRRILAELPAHCIVVKNFGRYPAGDDPALRMRG